jgi:hypothetical protein
MGNTIKPIADRARRVKRGSLANEDQEGHLKGILCIVGIREQPAANAEDHRPMPADQNLEGRFIALVNVALQEIGVRHARGFLIGQHAAKMSNYLAELLCRHFSCSISVVNWFYSILAEARRIDPCFFQSDAENSSIPSRTRSHGWNTD